MPGKQLTRNVAKNPFTPEFGRVPPYLAGRQGIIADMVRAFDEGGSNPNLCSIFVGARGSGKTALLSYIGIEAERLGWITVDVTASKGMLEDIVQRSKEQTAHLIAADSGKKLSGIEIANVGAISWENESSEIPNWRTKMNAILDALSETGAGLLITVDEVDPSLDEMTQLVTTYQHFIREDRKVALLMAGLPHNVSALLSGKSTSFLRRAFRHDLGVLPEYEVEEAFRLTVEDGGKLIEEDALKAATKAIGGFPFMFQLVGYRSWNAVKGASINGDAVKVGAGLAQKELKSRIFDATYAELSKADRAFVFAMLKDKGHTSRQDLVKRLGKGTSHVSTYKKRLLEAGVIQEPEPGLFEFALPGFKEYLQEKKRN